MAPHTHLSHIKDAVLGFVEYGLERQVRACGDGVIDWAALLSILAEFSPALRLSLEDTKSLMPIHVYDPTWLAGHPDLSSVELASLVRLAQGCETRIRAHEIPSLAEYQAIPYEVQKLDNLQRSAAHLRDTLRALDLDRPRIGP